MIVAIQPAAEGRHDSTTPNTNVVARMQPASGISVPQDGTVLVGHQEPLLHRAGGDERQREGKGIAGGGWHGVSQGFD